MSEKYYVVSEAELEALRDESFANGAGLGHAMQAMAEAEAACRARPVPEWATHFKGIRGTTSIGHGIAVEKEIKR